MNDGPKAACVSRWSVRWWCRRGGQVPFNVMAGLWVQCGGGQRNAGIVNKRAGGNGLQFSVVSEAE